MIIGQAGTERKPRSCHGLARRGLRDDLEPELGEVAGKDEGVGDAQALHHREADRVDEAERLVAVPSEDDSRLVFISLAHTHDLVKPHVDLVKGLKGGITSSTGQDECVRLRHDEIGRVEMAATLGKLP